MESNIVRKHNDIIEACYDMTTPELRLVYSCISKIGFDETITDKKPFFISATEYSEAFAVDQSHVHREIRKAVNGMWDRELTIHRKDDTPLVCRWIDAKAQYGDGGAEIHFSSHVIPYLTSLREGGNFTIYQLEN